MNLSIEELCWDIGTFGNFVYKRSWLNLSNSSCQIRVDKVQFYCGRLQLLGFLAELNHFAKALRSFLPFWLFHIFWVTVSLTYGSIVINRIAHVTTECPDKLQL